MKTVSVGKEIESQINQNNRKRFKFNYSSIGLLVLFVLLITYFSVMSPFFLSVNNFLNIFLSASVLGVIAIAMTFVIISGGIDLSVGSVVALTGVITVKVYSQTSSITLAVLAGLAIGLILGLLNGFLITKININPLITTLGTMSIGRGLAFVLSGGLTASITNLTFDVLGRGYFLGIPVPVIIMIIGFLLAGIVLRKTVFGRTVYAIGGNETASRLAAIKVNKNKIAIYIISGLASALGGLILTSQLAAGAPQASTGIELSVIAAVILGGCSLTGGKGTIIGTFLGVIIMGTLNNGLVLLNVSSYYQDVARGAVLLAAVAIDQLKMLKKDQ